MAGEQFKGKKYNLVKWETVCKSKKKGGLGVKNIRKMNISLLCKWWWKLETEEGLWQNIVKAKYIKGDTPIGAIKHRLEPWLTDQKRADKHMAAILLKNTSPLVFHFPKQRCLILL